ncbi:hypothetical protein OIE75_27745 [Streptomyces sp. NBC_01723]|nr:MULTISPECIES: hypothetical protein [unclassified Streptomyces]MDQ0406763.1 membrane associated rhomboid family serine protease [Streptomyces sp. DSM 40167]
MSEIANLVGAIGGFLGGLAAMVMAVRSLRKRRDDTSEDPPA